MQELDDQLSIFTDLMPGCPMSQMSHVETLDASYLDRAFKQISTLSKGHWHDFDIWRVFTYVKEIQNSL